MDQKLPQLSGPNPVSPEDAFRRFQNDRFWTDVLFEKYPSPADAISAMPALQISSGPFWPVLIRVKQWNQAADWRKRFDLGSTIVESIYQWLHCDQFENGCVKIEDGRYIAILRSATFASKAALLLSCRDLSVQVADSLGCELCCYVAPPSAIEALSAAADLLMDADKNNVSGRSPMVLEQGHPSRALDVLPDMKQWYYLLSEHKFDQLLMELEQFWLRDGTELHVSRTSLIQFIQDFNQLLSASLMEKSIPSRLIFATERGVELLRNAQNSVSDTLNWCFWSVTQFSVYLEQENRKKNYTEQAKDFIRQHLNQEFTRQEIASYVHLSQNHLARLFKKETGMSISEYIIQERMKLAFELLAHTDLPVGEVAARVGYENYSYFLTLFRRITNMRPSEYRKRCRDNTEGGFLWTGKH